MKDAKKSEIYNLTMKHAAVYIIITLVLYSIEILGGMFIENISLIFNFMSSISGSALCFIFPGSFYLSLEKKFTSGNLIGKNTKMRLIRFSAYLYIIIGIFTFALLLTTNILELINPEPNPEQ